MSSCIGHCNCGDSGKKITPKIESTYKKELDEKAEKMNAKEVLAQFEAMCGEMLIGKGDEDQIERITKAMVRTKQQGYMGQEFKKIGEMLKG